VKIKISLGKGKTKFDKRETLKRKEWDKEKSKISKLSSKLQ
jgi:tmRNA-binding protein